MKILITGSTSFLGTHLINTLLKRADNKVSSLDRGESFAAIPESRRLFFGPTTSFERIYNVVTEHSFDCIVHVAAMSSFAGCESNPSEARLANVEYTKALLKCAEETGAYLSYISTDLVFDGNDDLPQVGGYTEDNEPTPRSIYAKTKREAEKLVMSSGIHSSVLRTCLLYGSLAGSAGGPLRWIIERLKAGEEIPVFFDEWRTPIWVGDLVRAIEFMLTTKLSGIYHCAGPDRVNRVEFAESVASALGAKLKTKVVSRTSVSGPSRPEDVSLRASLIQNHLKEPFLSLKEGLLRSVK